MAFANRTILACIVLQASFSCAALAQREGMRFTDVSLKRPPVEGKPFSAEESVENQVFPFGQPAAPVVRKYRLYRDSQGRTASVPAEVPGGYNINLKEVDDQVAGYWYILDSARHIAHRIKMPPAMAPPKPAASHSPEHVVTLLGSQTLLGVQAEGRRDYINGNMVERWDCRDLQLVMLLRTSNQGGQGLTQITSLNLGDPPAEIFQIPPDYKVVDETSPFTLK